MSYATIASLSYGVPEGTYTVELMEEGGATSSRDLHLLKKPLLRASSQGLFGLVKQNIRIQVRDVNQVLLNRLESNADLKLKVSGPIEWEGPLHKVEDIQRSEDTPNLRLRFRDLQGRLLQGEYSLSDTREVPVLFYDLLQQHGGSGLLRTSIDWEHVGQNAPEARYLRVLSEEVSFLKYQNRGDSEKDLDILKGLLQLFNCRLMQHDGKWLIRRVASLADTMTVLEYDGQSYQGGTVNYGFTADDATILRRINDRNVRAQKVPLGGLQRVASRRYRYDQQGFQNEEFTEWTDTNPDHWDRLYSDPRAVVTEEPNEWARLSQNQGSFLRQRATQATIGAVDIHLEAEVPPTANDGETYTIHFAELMVENTESGTLYYDGSSQSWGSTPFQFSFDFTVDTTSGSGTEPGDMVSHTLSFSPPTPPSSGAPVLHLLYDWSSAGPDVRFVQFDRGVWDTQSTDLYGREHFAVGDGSSDLTFHSFVGDRTNFWPLSGVIHYYDGSDWQPATREWEGPDLGQTAPPALHVRRILERLRQRRNQVFGLRMHVPRSKALSPAVVPVVDSIPYAVRDLQVSLGVGAARVDAFPVQQFSAPLSTYDYQDLS